MLKCLEALSEGASDVTFITHLSNNNTTIVIFGISNQRTPFFGVCLKQQMLTETFTDNFTTVAQNLPFFYMFKIKTFFLPKMSFGDNLHSTQLDIFPRFSYICLYNFLYNSHTISYAISL